jgi:hypothetical protein
MSAYDPAAVRELLKQWFPWLGTDEELKSCADQVEQICFLYEHLEKELLPVAVIRRGKLHCSKCGKVNLPALYEYGYSIRHEVHEIETVNRKEKQINASGGDSSDFSESGDDYRLACPQCFAEYLLPAGTEIHWQ